MSNWSDEETDDPVYADRRNFYKVEKWSRDGLRVELMLYAGNDLDKARRIFERTIKHRPRIRLTIRQRMRVLDEWPRHETLLEAARRGAADRGEHRKDTGVPTRRSNVVTPFPGIKHERLASSHRAPDQGTSDLK